MQMEKENRHMGRVSGENKGGGCEEGRDSARSAPGHGHGLPMYAQNCITVPRGFVDGQPATHSGAAVRAILDHFQQA